MLAIDYSPPFMAGPLSYMRDYLRAGRPSSSMRQIFIANSARSSLCSGIL